MICCKLLLNCEYLYKFEYKKIYEIHIICKKAQNIKNGIMIFIKIFILYRLYFMTLCIFNYILYVNNTYYIYVRFSKKLKN